MTKSDVQMLNKSSLCKVGRGPELPARRTYAHPRASLPTKLHSLDHSLSDVATAELVHWIADDLRMSPCSITIEYVDSLPNPRSDHIWLIGHTLAHEFQLNEPHDEVAADAIIEPLLDILDGLAGDLADAHSI